MTSHNRFGSLLARVGLAALLACAIAAPAVAADPVFPVGSRLGLVPPPGMVASETFDGFSVPGEDSAILIAILPPAAYAQIEKSLDPEALKKQGVNLEKREPIQLSFGKGILLSGHQVATDKSRYRKWLLIAAASDFTALVTVQVPENDKTYNDRAVRAALATLAMRDKVPDAEELALLPFAVGDLAGFHIDGVLRGRALMLSDPTGAKDATKDTAGDSTKPAEGAPPTHLLIAALPGGPREPDEHANFARLSFGEIGGIRDVQVTMSEPLRINGQSGYQTMADAKDARTGADIRVVQWLRFGGGGFLQMVGMAPTDSWTSVLARLRAVRDSIDAK
jgi:hypothetical protein